MTLSRWLRDYLYIPLGGNRAQRAAHLPEPVPHHGDRRAVARRQLDLRRLGRHPRRLPGDRAAHQGAVGPARAARRARCRSSRSLQWLLTFNVVCLAWVFFRAVDIGDRVRRARAAVHRDRRRRRREPGHAARRDRGGPQHRLAVRAPSASPSAIRSPSPACAPVLQMVAVAVGLVLVDAARPRGHRPVHLLPVLNRPMSRAPPCPASSRPARTRRRPLGRRGPVADRDGSVAMRWRPHPSSGDPRRGAGGSGSRSSGTPRRPRGAGQEVSSNPRRRRARARRGRPSGRGRAPRRHGRLGQGGPQAPPARRPAPTRRQHGHGSDPKAGRPKVPVRLSTPPPGGARRRPADASAPRPRSPSRAPRPVADRPTSNRPRSASRAGRSFFRPVRSNKPGTMPAGMVLAVVVVAARRAMFLSANVILRKADGRPDNAEWRKTTANGRRQASATPSARRAVQGASRMPSAPIMGREKLKTAENQPRPAAGRAAAPSAATPPVTDAPGPRRGQRRGAPPPRPSTTRPSSPSRPRQAAQDVGRRRLDQLRLRHRGREHRGSSRSCSPSPGTRGRRPA